MSMLERIIRAYEARRHFGKLLRDVQNKQSVILERNGERVAAVVPIEVYEGWKRDRSLFFGRMREAAERADLSEDEAQREVAEAVREVRRTS
jgi:prevent-host-death family protein